MTQPIKFIFIFISMALYTLTAPSGASACNPRTPYQKSADLTPITTLKELHLHTDLKQAVIVTPKRYKKLSKDLKKMIKKISAGKIKVKKDTHVTPALLNTRNVIAIGNMATNAFIRKLYQEWYTLLDLKYPGGDGYVVRTLHNPYGAGYNVILLGGSSDKGVLKAVAKFKRILKKSKQTRSGHIRLPRLMKIRLSRDYQLPKIRKDIGPDISNWNVPSWRDFYRYNQEPHRLGWNPISIAGILYHITGKRAYLNLFKTLAMPSDSQTPPAALADHPAFYDPSKPLTDVYHYHTHLVDLVWDLIEESPGFTDEERLFITNRLLEHQDFLDPEHDNIALNPDRHCSYDMLNIYTGSRYFGKYYPDKVWNPPASGGSNVWAQRIDNVRASFDSVIGNPSWSGIDTLAYTPTYAEVIFDFFMLDGFDRFVQNPESTARTLMTFFEIIRTGAEADGDFTLNFMTSNLLNKAAFMLEDDRYVWLLKNLGFDAQAFRIGQSFWYPGDDMSPPEPPQDVAGNVLAFPLSDYNWLNTNQHLTADQRIDESQGFQVLSFRSGMTQYDDFLQLDGFNGKGRNPYHLNTLYWLRMFGDAATETAGIPVLWGYANDLDILYNGTASLHQAKCAALKHWHVTPDQNLLYLQTEVPNMPASKWKRHIVYLKDNAAVVIDQVIAKQTGNFRLTCSWSLFASILNATALPDITTSRGILFSHADNSDIQLEAVDNPEADYREGVTQQMAAALETGASVTMGSAFSRTGFNSFIIRRIKDHAGAYLLIKDGTPYGLAVMGHFLADGYEIEAEFAFHTPDTALQVVNGAVEIREQPDAARFAAMLNSLDICAYEPPTEDEVEINWQPLWRQSLKGEPALLDVSEHAWIAANDGDRSHLIRFDPLTGEAKGATTYASPMFSLYTAKNEAQAAVFDVLAGFRDNRIMAYRADGDNIVGDAWGEKVQIHPAMLALNAPWFTSDIPGVFSFSGIAVPGMNEKIAVGLASTIELRNLDGARTDSLPSRYGSNTHLGVLPDFHNMLIAGKRLTGYPFFSGIIHTDGAFQNVSDNLFYNVASDNDLTAMHAWNQNGVCQLVIDDINNDAIQEVIFTLGGHWNELRVYRSDQPTSDPLWLTYFGPGEVREDFMKGLAVIQLTPDTNGIVTATRDGRVNLFDANGNILWARDFNQTITRMHAVRPNTSSPGIIVGFANGIITYLDKGGQSLLNAQLESAPLLMDSDQANLYCAEQSGAFSAFGLDR